MRDTSSGGAKSIVSLEGWEISLVSPSDKGSMEINIQND
jgi:hypothetical protein